MSLGRRVSSVVAALGALAAAGASLATLLAVGGRLWWRLDLFSHFRLQYVAVLAGAVALLAITRRWRLAAPAAVFLVFNIAAITPLYVPTGAVAAPGRPSLRVVSFNVHDHNTDYDAVARYLAAADADVVVITEASATWIERVGAALPGYDELSEPRDDSFGIAAWSRRDLDRARIVTLADAGVPAVELELEIGGEPFAVLGVHTLPPLSADYAARRDAMLDAIARWARRSRRHTVVIGDLNTTPWSASFHRLVSAGLINSQLGHGVQPSWPGGLVALAIPIDHCLHGPSLTATERSTGPFLGSDHRPLHVTLAVVDRWR